MRRRLAPGLSKPLVVLLSLSMAAAAWGQDALREMVAAEKEFAQKSLTHGIGQSFVQYLADDSVVLNPAPINGQEFYRKFDSHGRRLFWQPVFAVMARSGDFGLTTGPWEMRERPPSEKAIGFGQFVSIWRKVAGVWKVALDGGNENSQPAETPGDLVSLEPAGPPIEPAKARQDLAAARQNLGNLLKEGAGSGIVVSASEDIRVLRDNAAPAEGKTAAKLMLSSDNGKMQRKTIGEIVASSADLACAYGSYLSARANVTERGYFLTVWRLEPDSQWRIVLDLQNKSPEKK